MNVNMVWVLVSANWVKRNNNIRLDLADVFHDLARHLFNGMVDLRIGVLVGFHAGHA